MSYDLLLRAYLDLPILPPNTLHALLNPVGEVQGIHIPKAMVITAYIIILYIPLMVFTKINKKFVLCVCMCIYMGVSMHTHTHKHTFHSNTTQKSKSKRTSCLPLI